MPRALWGLRAKQRAWYDSMVAGTHLRRSGKGRMAPRSRPCGSHGGDGGASKLGCQQVALGVAPPCSRRSTPESVAQPGPDCNRSPPTICSTMCPDLDNDSFGLHEGSRCPLLKKNRALGRRGQGLIRSRFQDSSAESSAQAQTRERQRRVKQSVSERGKANLRPRGVLQLEEKCSHEDAFRGEDHACFSPCAEGVFLGTTIPVSMQANSLQKLQILCEEKLGFQNFPFPLQLGACQPQDGFFVRAQLWDDSCTLSLCRDGPMAPPTALLPLPLPCFRP